MRKINNSQLMNAHTVELFTRAHQSVLDGKQVDEANLKTLLNLTQKVYDNGFSKNTESVEDQYHVGYYLEDLPESLTKGDCRNQSKDLYKLFIYEHYAIEPSLVVDYINKYFDDLKNNVYTYLLIINLISFTTEWQLPNYMIYQFTQLFIQFEDL